MKPERFDSILTPEQRAAMLKDPDYGPLVKALDERFRAFLKDTDRWLLTELRKITTRRKARQRVN